jgi:small neutral amino acid transporter SnatA (MarC family)
VFLDVFSVAGGGVLSWIDFSMLTGKPGTDQGSGSTNEPWSLTPLILFASRNFSLACWSCSLH